MTKMLIALVFLYVGIVFGATINDLYTVQTGTDPGTCDANQVTTLDNWVTESYNSLAVAIAAVAFYNEDSVRGNNVRQAMLIYFKIPNRITATVKSLVVNVDADLLLLQEFFNDDLTNINVYLFCDSDWLIEEDPEAQAYDFEGNPVVDSDGDITAINAIPAYISQLTGNNVPWWSGSFTSPSVYGYTFAPTLNAGGNYCQLGTNSGYTLKILRYNDGEYEGTIICPSAFTNAQPANYAAGIGMITTGLTGTTLEVVVPQSATLLHEAMHNVFGAGRAGFLQGNAEQYGLARVVQLALINQGNARRNPESYVYFIATMNYMFGTAAADGITTNINFVYNPFNAQACGAGSTQCA